MISTKLKNKIVALLELSRNNTNEAEALNSKEKADSLLKDNNATYRDLFGTIDNTTNTPSFDWIDEEYVFSYKLGRATINDKKLKICPKCNRKYNKFDTICIYDKENLIIMSNNTKEESPKEDPPKKEPVDYKFIMLDKRKLKIVLVLASILLFSLVFNLVITKISESYKQKQELIKDY
jgi:hypothetical protein